MPTIEKTLTKANSFNGAQKRLGHYLQNDSAALMLSNVSNLAHAVGVSESTVACARQKFRLQGIPGIQARDHKQMWRKLRAGTV